MSNMGDKSHYDGAGHICAVMAAIELYTPQGAEMVSGMIYEPYEPYEQG